jgi:hypothetical protein
VYIGLIGAGAEASVWLGYSITPDFLRIRLDNLPSTEGFVKELAKIVCGVK